MTDSHADPPGTSRELPSSEQPICDQYSQPAVTPMESTRFAISDAAALADLQMHWGSAYVITLDGDIWSATFRGTVDDLRAHTWLELRMLIRADYAYRRQAGPPTIRGERMSM